MVVMRRSPDNNQKSEIEKAVEKLVDKRIAEKEAAGDFALKWIFDDESPAKPLISPELSSVELPESSQDEGILLQKEQLNEVRRGNMLTRTGLFLMVLTIVVALVIAVYSSDSFNTTFVGFVESLTFLLLQSTK